MILELDATIQRASALNLKIDRRQAKKGCELILTQNG